MNGRIYDPKLGRFLQADPIIQAPKNSQNLNRYSYVLNNPLSSADPSGYFSFGDFLAKWGRVAIAAVAGYFTFGTTYAWAATGIATAAGSSAGFAQLVGTVGWQVMAGIVAGSSAGFVSGAIISGSARGALKGAFAGAITAGVAKQFGGTYNAERIFADSLAGGTVSRIYGGSFEDGFVRFALVSSFTLINIKLQEYARLSSSRTPGQIAKNNPGFRNQHGGISGERFREAAFVKSGAKELIDAGWNPDWVRKNIYEPYLRAHKIILSPLGGLQGSDIKRFLIWDFDPNGSSLGRFINYVQEGFGGPHDSLNQWFFYNDSGVNRTLSTVEKAFGRILNPVDVVLAAPLSVPALIPDYGRYYYYAMRDID